jgi:threonine/homoserine/homoserine lactone efflux protein
MTAQLFSAFVLFAFVSSITPGPNNAMLLASGANFGMARSIPHMLGVSAGFLMLLLSVGLGLGGLFAAFPALHGALQVVGALYLLYLAWKIATAKGLGGGVVAAQPQRFWPIVAFQWVNPKAWAMALGAMTTYAPKTHYVAGVFLVSGIFAAVNLPCIFAWTGFGVGLRRFLDRPVALKIFNLVMAALLVASLIPLVLEWIGR